MPRLVGNHGRWEYVPGLTANDDPGLAFVLVAVPAFVVGASMLAMGQLRAPVE